MTTVQNPTLSAPARALKARRADRLTPRARLLVVSLCAFATGLILYKLSGLPGSSATASYLSFEQLPAGMQARTHHLLFAPVGALVVVWVRLTLGIRVLGPFRSVLLAIAFQMTGAIVGVAFFALVVAVVALVRPHYKPLKLAYFGRSAAMLATVAGIVVATMLVGLSLGIREVEHVAYFPIVVLTLAGDAFASTMRKEGIRSAFWRAGTTAIVALAIAAIASVHSIQAALVRFPELLCVVLAAIVVVASALKFRLFQRFNPPPKKPKRKRRPHPPDALTSAPVATTPVHPVAASPGASSPS